MSPDDALRLTALIRDQLDDLRDHLIEGHRLGIDIAEAMDHSLPPKGMLPAKVEAALRSLAAELVDGIRSGSIR